MLDYGINLSAMMQKEPWALTRWIATAFGYVIDFLFNIVYAITVENSLGLSIILLTILFRFAMLPLSVRSQKSMTKMQKLNPEVEKIRAKYGGSKDPEIQQKMNTEIQTLYSKNKVNPLGGCLPILIQFPLFFGISYIMQQSYLFIPRLRDIYTQLSNSIISVADGNDAFLQVLENLVMSHRPNGMLVNPMIAEGAYGTYNGATVWAEGLNKAISKFSTADWNSLFASIPAGLEASIQEFYNLKQSVETFFSLPLIDAVGLTWPGIMIPILAGLTSVATAWLSSRAQPKSSDDKVRTQQNMMMIVMPIMMTVMTINLPGGVGIYWITGSVFQIVQQIIMNQKAGIPLFKKKEEH